MTERLLTARELADRLGVSTGALLRWTRAGKVPGAVKLPSGAIRYLPERVDAWLADDCAMADGATEEVSPAPNAVRRMEVSSLASPVPLRDVAAST
jgi:predicted DNA-binding transcriptional regulator AlpA